MTQATKLRADVYVGIPTNEGVLHQMMYGAYERMVHKASKKGYTIARTLTNNRNLPLSLTKIVETAIRAEAKYVLFMSPDIIVPEDALLKLMDRKVPIVSGLYVETEKPYHPEAYIQPPKKNHKEPDKPIEYFMELDSNGIHEVTYTGFGLCLIETAVFKELKKPWFVLTPEVLECEYFFKKLKTLKIKSHVDASVKCMRLGLDIYSVNDSLYYKPETKEVDKKATKKVAKKTVKKVEKK